MSSLATNQIRTLHKPEERASSRPVSVGVETAGLAVIVALAVIVRVWLTATSTPLADSDEATMGLMALHIAFRGERPIFFYGQNYMGALEAYLAAPLVRVFGASVLALRLPLIIMFALFLVVAFRLLGILYSARFALVAVAIISLGSVEILYQELGAIGGYAETLLFGTVLLLFSVELSLPAPAETRRAAWGWRLVGYAAWGLVAGLGLWSDLLIAPFVAAAGLLLVCFRWRQLIKGFALPLLICLVIGIWPLARIIHRNQESRGISVIRVK